MCVAVRKGDLALWRCENLGSRLPVAQSPSRQSRRAFMPQVLVAECKQESSSFNPVLSHYEDFGVAVGSEILARPSRCKERDAGALTSLVHIRTSRWSRPSAPAPSPPAVSWTRRDSTGSPTSSWTPSARPGGGWCLLRPARRHGGPDEHDTEGHLLAETRKILGERIRSCSPSTSMGS